MGNTYEDSIVLLKKLSAIKDNLYLDDIKEIEELLEEDSYKVAIIGEFSVGKSTFLNSLIGKRILYSSAQEATGVLTAIKNSKNKVANIIYENNTSDTIDLNSEKSYLELKNYLDKNRSDEKIIKTVNINYPMAGIDKDVIVLDTPGLQGIREKELLVTKMALKEANATIVIINHKGLTGSELSLLKGELKDFGKIKTKEITLVINKIGELYENRTVEEGRAKVNRVVESVNNTLAENNLNNINVFALDSRDYLWGIDDDLYKIATKENNSKIYKMLTKEEYLERSLFGNFKQYLHEFLNKDNREAKFYEDIKERILVLLDGFKEELNNNEEVEYRDKILKNLENQKSLINDNRRMIINAAKRQLRGSIEEFEASLEEDIKNEIKEIKKKILIYIKDNIKSQECLNNRHRELVSQYVQKILSESSSQYIDKLKKYQSNINLLLSNTFNKEFSNVFAEKKDIRFFINPSEVNFDFKYKENKSDADDDIVKSLEEYIKVREEELKTKKNEFNQYSKEFSKEILKYEYKININENNFKFCKLRLGQKPEPTQEYVMETRTKKTWIFFKEDYQVKVLGELNYSKVNEWEKKIEECVKTYNNTKQDLLKKIDRLNMEKLESSFLEKKIIKIEDSLSKLKVARDNAIKKKEIFIKAKREMFFENKKEELYLYFGKLTDEHFSLILDKINDILNKFNKITIDTVDKQSEIHFEDFKDIIEKRLSEYKNNRNRVIINEEELIKEIINAKQMISMEV